MIRVAVRFRLSSTAREQRVRVSAQGVAFIGRSLRIQRDRGYCRDTMSGPGKTRR